ALPIWKVARNVPKDAPATEEQRRAAWSHYREIVAIVQRLVIDEWETEVFRLATEAESWCHKEGWLTKMKKKKLKDKFLNEYEVAQLLIHTTESQLLLDPITRFAVGASGLLDLFVLPSCESVMVT